MDRRTFLKAGPALPTAAVIAGLPRLAGANTGSAWRAYEVVTRVQVLDAEGVTRVWLPAPLTVDTDYFKNLGSTWRVEGGKVAYVEEPKHRAGILSAQFESTTQNPVLVMTSRFATRDRAFASLQDYLVPGDTFASDVYYFISDGMMPPFNPRVPADLQAMLAAWIDAGAPNN